MEKGEKEEEELEICANTAQIQWAGIQKSQKNGVCLT